MNKEKRYIAVDLDGTLAVHPDTNHYVPTEVGEPLKPMVDIVKKFLKDGEEVKILTARAYQATPDILAAIHTWLIRNIGQDLEVTCQKTHLMKVLFDDRAVRVHRNEGSPFRHSYLDFMTEDM